MRAGTRARQGADEKSTSGGSPGNPTITELAPNVVSIGPDYNTGGVVFEVYDATM